MRYKILPHTADLRLKVFGKDYEELFQNAALGLALILDKEIERKIKFTRGAEKVSVNGQGWETLLVNFLNEILALSNINKKVYPRVKILKFSPNHLETQISGLPVDKFDEDVKAVSHHEAKIKKTEKGLETMLVLDI